MLLIGQATALAMQLGYKRVLIGCHDGDNARFPDCTAAFIEHMDTAARRAYGVRIIAPMRQRYSSNVPGTWSCYQGGAKPGGRCVSCHQDHT